MKSPGEWTVEGLFSGRPEALALFHAVRRYIESIGPVKVEAMKTQVSFGAKTKFAWVWLPQLWTKKRPENSITLTFDVGRHIEHDRIVQAVEPRPGRWTHHVIIESEADLNEDVREWLREAYAFGQNRKSKRPGAL
ncbi:MAG: hypothetical protein A4E53_03452 [Pelotomaculum sp. PtaB.Bin104]|nr:MAG: hypothetical protein A4E53_03452 [Pelotomaculum sp. PtaB.Bin104]